MNEIILYATIFGVLLLLLAALDLLRARYEEQIVDFGIRLMEWKLF